MLPTSVYHQLLIGVLRHDPDYDRCPNDERGKATRSDARRAIKPKPIEAEQQTDCEAGDAEHQLDSRLCNLHL